MSSTPPPVSDPGTATKPLAAQPHRIGPLDGLRGCASLMVMLYHLFLQPLRTIPGSPAAYVSRALSLGWTGVDLFFVLSGFLIAGILLDSRSSPSYFQTFYVRRVCRIFPLYYFLLLIYSAGVLSGTGNWDGLLSRSPSLSWYWLFLQNFRFASLGAAGKGGFFMGGVWLAATWSLAVEEQFYLLLPTLVRAVRSTAGLALSAVGLIVLANAIRLGIRVAYPGEAAERINYVLLFTRMDALAVGVLLACAYRGRYWAALKRPLPLVLLAGAGLTGAILFRRLEFAPFSYTVYAVFYGALLVSAIESKGLWRRFLSSRAMVYLGTISYGTYLFHPVVLGLLSLWFFQRAPAIDTPGSFLLSVAAGIAAIVLAGLSFRFVERRFLAFGKRFRY